jgi:hypothetical protein
MVMRPWRRAQRYLREEKNMIRKKLGSYCFHYDLILLVSSAMHQRSKMMDFYS